MEILIALMLKHTLADYFLNRKYMGKDKHLYLKGGKLHSFTHFYTCLFTLLFFVEPDIAVACALIDGLAHYHIDWTKSKIIQKYKLFYNGVTLRTLIGVDQLLHFLTYILIVALIH
jgi:hypothetical protein